jgi:PAS domain S-box-containing protein
MRGKDVNLSELLLQSVVDYAIYMLDREGRVVSWNPGAERIKGYSASEIIGQHFSRFYTPEDREAGLPLEALETAEREGRYDAEGWRVRKDGSRFWASVVIDAIRDDTGASIGFAKVTRDLTERYEAQRRLAYLQRMEALGQLAGGMAHDFNNVLQAVQGGAFLIQRRPSDLETVRRIAHMINEATERGAAITRRLLVFFRRGDLRSEAVDPVALLADLREILVHTLGAGVAIQVKAQAGLPGLMADKGQLETVLVNLATNARDAMNGRGTLVLSATSETARDVTRQKPVVLKEGRYVRLSLSDTGHGMTPEMLARASEPFFTTKPHGQGTGLGLDMARGFAEQSGGTLHIESAVGFGTTVSLWLPQAETQISATAAPDASEASSREARGIRVLVVDDEPMVRHVLAEQLTAAGYAVASAADGTHGLAMLDGAEPMDLIVSDLSMPGMDGLAFIREAQRRHPKLPAILLTGFATNAAQIALSGMFSLLRKPVTTVQLTERVEMLLAGTGKMKSSRTEPSLLAP